MATTASPGASGSATSTAAARRRQIIDVLGEAFEPLMRADPASFRTKYRKLARDPHSFYRGTACLFHADVTSDFDEAYVGPWTWDLRRFAASLALIGWQKALPEKQDLVELQVEEAVVAVLEGRRRAFVDDVTEFGLRYAGQVREDHDLFVDAFRAGDIGVGAT